MERAIYFKNYRNLGLDNDEKLVLNNSLEKGKMGNLVILIGPNNSGKSNILDGLNSYYLKEFNQTKDITTLYFDNDHRNPQISLKIKDGEEQFCHSVSFPNKEVFDHTPVLTDLDLIKLNNLDELAIDIIQFITTGLRFDNIQGRKAFKKLQSTCDMIKEGESVNEIKKSLIEGMNLFFDIYGTNNYIWNEFSQNNLDSELVREIKKLQSKTTNKRAMLDDVFLEKYGISLYPQIIAYEEEPIRNNELSCQIGNQQFTSFIKTVFNKVGIELEEITNVYKTFKNQNNRGILLAFQNKINKKLTELSSDFNNLYYSNDEKYRFEIVLESDKIYLTLFRDDCPLTLEHQSTGFKWFFNLYFNLLLHNELKAGDIILMDEPATNLHVKGQIELRRSLKLFAMKNDITIVLATHSPFLIDVDNMDELRVVSLKNNKVSIVNDYTTIDLDDPDSLKPIKEALTITNNIILDSESTVVFVEGITDYNYYLAFKKKLRIKENIVFLPIKGVGDTRLNDYKEKQLRISKELIKIRKQNPILLVDGDKPGLDIQKLNKNDSELNVYSLKDINVEFRQIEDLFTKDDLKKINAIDSSGKYIKKSSNSSIVKTFVDEYEFDQVTLNNFQSVFDMILDNKVD